MKHFLKVFLIATFAISFRTSAEVVSNVATSIEINQNFQVSANLKIEISNSIENSIVYNYKIDFPFLIDSVNANLGGSNVAINIEKNIDDSILNIDFGSNFLKKGDTKVLDINIKSSNAVIKKFNVNYLKWNAIKSNISVLNSTYSLSYSKDLGDFTFFSQLNYTKDNLNEDIRKLSFNTKNKFLIFWGNPKLNLEVNTFIENSSNNMSSFLLPIPSKNLNAEFLEISKGEFALFNEYGSEFALINLPTSSKSKIFYSANVDLSNLQSNNFLYKVLPFEFSTLDDSKVLKDLEASFNKTDSIETILINVNEYLFNNYSLQDEIVNKDYINSVWQNSEKRISMLQYCNLISSIAKKYNFKTVIEYGYPLLDFNTSSSIPPSIWCVVTTDNGILKFDLLLQKRLGFPFVSNTLKDSISFGMWDFSLGYNSLLGYSFNKPILANLLDFKPFLQNSNNLDISLDFPNAAYSGEFYSGILNINNFTNKVHFFNDLKLNGFNITEMLKVGDLKKALLPLNTNRIKLDYLRENDFILNQEKEVFIEANISQLDLQASKIIKFEPDIKLILVFVSIFGVVNLLVVYLVIKIFRKKLF